MIKRKANLWKTLRILKLAAVICFASSFAIAQWPDYPTPGIPRTPDGKPNLTAPAPQTPDRKPDLSGIWSSPQTKVNIALSMKPGETVPFQPWTKEVFDQRQATNSKDDPAARCLPTVLTVRPTLPTPFKILQTRW
jgi:hypothetical protein